MILTEYVAAHVLRGECQCGKCADRIANPEEHQPTGHTADMMFFKVALKPDKAGKDADIETFKRLTREQRGEWGDVIVLDGQEHNYMELGGWIGDQGLAMMYMGMGALLGVFTLLTPRTLLGSVINDETAMMMAGQGMIAVMAKKEHKN